MTSSPDLIAVLKESRPAAPAALRMRVRDTLRLAPQPVSDRPVARESLHPPVARQDPFDVAVKNRLPGTERKDADRGSG